MEAIIRAVILSMVQTGATASAQSSSNSLAAATLWTAVAAVLAAAGIGCAAIALWLWQATSLGPVGASLVVSGVLLTAALAAWAAMRRALVPPKHSPTPTEPLDVLLAEAGRLFKENKAAALAAAFAAGLAAERYDRKK